MKVFAGLPVPQPAGLPEEADNERETEGASVESEQSSGHPPPQQKLRLIGCLSFDDHHEGKLTGCSVPQVRTSSD